MITSGFSLFEKPFAAIASSIERRILFLSKSETSHFHLPYYNDFHGAAKSFLP
jgi:hypothetical protein